MDVMECLQRIEQATTTHELDRLFEALAEMELSQSGVDLRAYGFIPLLHDYHAREEAWNLLLNHFSLDCLTDDVLSYLYANRIAPIAIAHKDLPDQWLKRYAEYDEAAAITLFRRYYLGQEYSAYDFYKVIIENDFFKNDLTMSLCALMKAENNQKLIFLLYFIRMNQFNQEVVDIIEEEQTYAYALITTSEEIRTSSQLTLNSLRK